MINLLNLVYEKSNCDDNINSKLTFINFRLPKVDFFEWDPMSLVFEVIWSF